MPHILRLYAYESNCSPVAAFLRTCCSLTDIVMAGYAHVGGPASSTTNGQLSQFAAASTSSASANASSSFSTKISDFVERNKRGLTIAAGATVVVAGAAGYYYYTRPVYRSSKPPDSDDGLGGDEGEESPTSQRKKGRKKKSRKPAANVPPSAVGVSSPAPTLTDTAPETTASLPTINVETSSQTEPGGVAKYDCRAKPDEKPLHTDSLDLTSAQINALPPQVRAISSVPCSWMAAKCCAVYCRSAK